MKKIVGLLLGLLLAPQVSAQGLLPNAEQQFVDQNGAPLAGGSVTFYVPNTTTAKTTYSDIGLTTPNANPLTLDSAGRAIIWGSGNYREIVKDLNGNVVWDQNTSTFNSGQVVINATQYPGSDFGAQVNAACAALPSTGGIVDARAFSGTLSFASSINCGSDTKPVEILFPVGAKIVGGSGASVEYYSSSNFIGGSPINSPASATEIDCTGVSSCLVYGGAGSAANPWFVNINGIGFYITDANAIACDFTRLYYSEIRFTVCSGGAGGSGVKIGGTAGGAYYNHFIGVLATGTTNILHGYDFELDANQNEVFGGRAFALATSASAIYFNGASNNTIYSIDLEVANGPEFAANSNGNALITPYFEGTSAPVFDSTAAYNFIFGPTGLSATPVDNSGNYTNWLFGPPNMSPNTFGVQQTYLFGAGYDYGVGDVLGISTQGPNGDFLGTNVNFYGVSSTAYGRWGHSPLQVGRLVSRSGGVLLGQLSKQALATPTAPTITPHGVTGSTTYTYYVVCHDASGGVTLPSSAGTTTIGNATLGASNYNIVTWPAEDGCDSWDVLRGDTSHYTTITNTGVVASPTTMAGGVYGSGTMTFNDVNPSTTSYTAPVANTTGDELATSYPTTCTGHPSKTLWNNSNVVNICP